MDAVIDVVGPEQLPAIVELYNQIFRPPRDVASFRRRYLGRHNVLQMLATVQDARGWMRMVISSMGCKDPVVMDRLAFFDQQIAPSLR